ncbi:chemotaxis protein CheW [Endozoicomonas sp. SESOKO2]|uniref:chemotaxis protein CheW n=1 Tax=Endozoicomonas sp. SESOKO2 TaxID=2828743 RepID=UPI002148C1C9|nr:chemotaxis protein CheW [Endozoicomonas sp. SESOKO2]
MTGSAEQIDSPEQVNSPERMSSPERIKSRCLNSRLIPMQQKPLLLPVSCIADVVDYSRPSGGSETSPWLLGEIDWRGQALPLISFERINGGRFAEFSATARIAVMHSITGNEQLPFYGMVIQGIPQALDLTAGELQPAIEANNSKGSAETSRVIIRGIPAAIPDLEKVEQQLSAIITDRPRDTASH